GLRPRGAEGDARVLPAALRRRLRRLEAAQLRDDPQPRRRRRAARHGRRAPRRVRARGAARPAYRAPGVADGVTETRELPDVGQGTGLGPPWSVIVLNDDHNTFDGVAAALAAVLPQVSFELGL